MKNKNNSLKFHETSTKHIKSVISFARRIAAAGGQVLVDADLHKKYDIESHKHWIILCRLYGV